MTAAEKRFFKTHFSSNKNLVTDLFNFINNMKGYNEEEVKAHFKDSKLSKNLKVYKIMLSNLLLKSLSSFHYKKSLNSKIRQTLEEVEILVEKNLYGLAYKKLLKTKKLCIKFEIYDQLLIVLGLEYHFKAFYELDIPSDDLEVLEEAVHFSGKNNQLASLRKLNHELSLPIKSLMLKNKKADNFAQYEKILLEKSNSLKRNKSDRSFRELFYLYSSYSHLYHSSRQPQKEHKYKKKILDLFTKYPHFIEINRKKYWAAYFNYLNCCLRTERSNELLDGIKKLKEFTEEYPEFHLKRNLIYMLEIAYFNEQKKYDYIIKNIEPAILEHVATFEDEYEMSVIYSYIYLTLAHLAKGNHPRVQYYLGRLFRSGKDLNSSYTYFFETLNLISHYEKKDTLLLKNLLVSRKRKIKKEPDYGTPFFVEMIHFFTRLMDKKKNVPNLAKEFKSNTAAFEEDSVFTITKNFIYDAWLDALTMGKTYSEQIQSENYAEKNS